jgi:hypothetical protein
MEAFCTPGHINARVVADQTGSSGCRQLLASSTPIALTVMVSLKGRQRRAALAGETSVY